MHSDSTVIGIGSLHVIRHCQRSFSWSGVGKAKPSNPRAKESMRDFGLSVLWYLVRVLATLAYFFPTIAALRYRHPRQLEILYLNILLGWTVVGWAIALQWALQASKRPGSMERS
jgi:hypothetical protein